jgi:hypothetical protein
MTMNDKDEIWDQDMKRDAEEYLESLTEEE